MFKMGDTVIVTFPNWEDREQGLSKGDIGWVIVPGVLGVRCRFLTTEPPEIWMGNWQIEVIERKSDD